MSIKKIIVPHAFKDEPPAILCEPSIDLQKTAYSTNEELQARLKELSPLPKDHIHILLNALGSHETFGPNDNKDTFPEVELRAPPGARWGYKTFETDASVFRHHANSATSKRYGKVPAAFWNKPVRRVELLASMPISDNEDVLARIEKGDNIAFSMGTRVKYDICSWCGNKAPTRKEYCIHIRTMLGLIDDRGRACYMINHKPLFIDISLVNVPADKTAWMLEKVASETGYIHPIEIYSETVFKSAGAGAFERAELLKVAGVPESVRMAEIAYGEDPKEAKIRKISDIDKKVDGLATVEAVGMPSMLGKFRDEKLAALRNAEAELPANMLDKLAADFGGSDPLLSTFAAYGVVLKPREFQRLKLGEWGQGKLRDVLDVNDATFEGVDPVLYSGDQVKFAIELIEHEKAAAVEDVIGRKSYHRGGLLERTAALLPTNADEELADIDDETMEDHAPLLARIGGAFEDYSDNAMRFARIVAESAGHLFPDTDLTIRLQLSPSNCDNPGHGLPGVAMGASVKEAMRRYPSALRGGGMDVVEDLEKSAALFDAKPVHASIPGVISDFVVLRRLGL